MTVPEAFFYLSPGIYVYTTLKEGVDVVPDDLRADLKAIVKEKIGSFAVPEIIQVRNLSFLLRGLYLCMVDDIPYFLPDSVFQNVVKRYTMQVRNTGGLLLEHSSKHRLVECLDLWSLVRILLEGP